jgi:hypothetical protein
VALGELDQRRRLAGNRVLFPLFLGRHPRFVKKTLTRRASGVRTADALWGL